MSASGTLSVELKKRMVKETWCLTKQDIQRLEAMEMWIWRRMLRISWKDHITNIDVLERAEEKRKLIKIISERQATWIGHVLRHDSLLRDIIEGFVKGKRQTGRPRQMTIDWMMKDNGQTYSTLKEMAHSRAVWKQWCSGPAIGQRT